MSLFKRGLFSVIRKPVKSILLAAILFFIAVLLMMAVGIGQQQNFVQNEIRNQMGGSFRLEINWEEADRRMEPYVVEIEVMPDLIMGFSGGAPYNYYSLNLEDIEKIAQVDGLSGYNVMPVSTGVMPLNFDNDQSQASRGRHDPIDDMVTIQGILNLALLDEVLHGFISLQEGRFIEADDIGSEEVPLVISKDIADKNNLSIGDILYFEWEDNEFEAVLDHIEEERLENIDGSGVIVGIFEVERSMEALVNDRTLENTIFTAFDFTSRFFAGTRLENRDFNQLATFHVENLTDYDQIRGRILDLDLDWERYNLVDSNEMLSRLSSGFDGLEQVSGLMFVIVFATGFAMLWLIFVLWVRNRNHEIAILLAVGTEKVKIVSQFIFEALLVATLAFALATISLPLANQFIDVGELNAHFYQPEPIMWGDVEIDPSMISVASGDTTESMMEEDFHEMATSSISITAESVAVVILALVALISTSIMVSMIPVMRMKPKEIFSKMN